MGPVPDQTPPSPPAPRRPRAPWRRRRRRRGSVDLAGEARLEGRHDVGERRLGDDRERRVRGHAGAQRAADVGVREGVLAGHGARDDAAPGALGVAAQPRVRVGDRARARPGPGRGVEVGARLQALAGRDDGRDRARRRRSLDRDGGRARGARRARAVVHRHGDAQARAEVRGDRDVGALRRAGDREAPVPGGVAAQPPEARVHRVAALPRPVRSALGAPRRPRAPPPARRARPG